MPYSFLEIGMDAGFFASRSVLLDDPDLDLYSSLFPFAHYNAGLVTQKMAIYGGLGGGGLFATYKYTDGESRNLSLFAADVVAGFWFRGIDLSFTLRTDFSGANVIAALGYSWRF